MYFHYYSFTYLEATTLQLPVFSALRVLSGYEKQRVPNKLFSLSPLSSLSLALALAPSPAPSPVV